MMAPGTMYEARVRCGVLLCRWCEVADHLDHVVGIGLRQRLPGAHRFYSIQSWSWVGSSSINASKATAG